MIARQQEIHVGLIEDAKVLADCRRAHPEPARESRGLDDLRLVLREEGEELIERSDVLLADQPLDVPKEVGRQVVGEQSLLALLVRYLCESRESAETEVFPKIGAPR